MRDDMAKLLVERPRKGGGVGYPRAHVRQLQFRHFDDSPVREPHKSRHLRHQKWFNENLAPLRRFLRSSLGRPWDEVRAEISARVPPTSTVNYHVWQHLRWEVAERAMRVGDAVYNLGGHWGAPARHYGFYVDPDDGRLREAVRHSNRVRRLREKATARTPDAFQVDRLLEYHRISDVWYAVRFAFARSTGRAWDVLKRAEVYLIPGRERSERYAVAKRQLNKRQIAREIDPRLRRHERERQDACRELARLTRARQPSPGSAIFARRSPPQRATLQTSEGLSGGSAPRELLQPGPVGYVLPRDHVLQGRLYEDGFSSGFGAGAVDIRGRCGGAGGGCRRRPGGGGVRGAPVAEPKLGAGPTYAFDAVMYEVKVPAESLGRIDLSALDKAAGDAEAFEKALAGLGTAKPLFRAHQSVRLQGDSVTVGSQVPYVTNSRMTAAGQAVNTVMCRQVGTVFGLAGKVTGEKALEVDITVETSNLTEGTLVIGGESKAPVFWTAVIAHKGPATADKPFVAMAIDASQKDAEGNAYAVLTRITLGHRRGRRRRTDSPGTMAPSD
jgi:hypothetical protein